MGQSFEYYSGLVDSSPFESIADSCLHVLVIGRSVKEEGANDGGSTLGVDSLKKSEDKNQYPTQ